MRKTIALMLILCATSAFCGAEPRWCSVSGKDPTNTLVYPPIARAARVQGVVLAHMIYTPNGKVVGVEPISGPVMLSRALSDRLMGWTVKTDAIGSELCETLVIADFSFGDSVEPIHLDQALPSILRIAVQEQVLIISDPAAELSPFSRLRYMAWRIKKWFRQK